MSEWSISLRNQEYARQLQRALVEVLKRLTTMIIQGVTALLSGKWSLKRRP
jgi:hypothetical protein